MKIHFIDIGYGDAILLELPDNKKILIDAGDAQKSDRLIEYLSSRRVDHFDQVILTHPHKNHFGGLFSLIEQWPIGEFFTNGDNEHAEEGYSDLIGILKQKEIPSTILKEGDEFNWARGSVRCSILHPTTLEGSTNANALVLWIVFHETSFLLTSDIQEKEQEEIIARYPQLKKADVVLVPHHGGKISKKFAEFFREDTLFVVSTGKNKYGKPFVEELNKLRGKIIRTDSHGPVVLSSDGNLSEIINAGD